MINYTGKDSKPTLPKNYNGDNYVINQYAFEMNNNISEIIIPNSVTSIGTYAFNKCLFLEKITIPSSVTHIGSYAFYNCNMLSEAIFKNTNNWWYAVDPNATNGEELTSEALANTSTAAKCLRNYKDYKFYNKHWFRS